MRERPDTCARGYVFTQSALEEHRASIEAAIVHGLDDAEAKRYGFLTIDEMLTQGVLTLDPAWTDARRAELLSAVRNKHRADERAWELRLS